MAAAFSTSRKTSLRPQAHSMRNLKRWRSPDGSLQLDTCARPGRSKGKDRTIENKTVDEWVRGLPGGSNTVIVSLLGRKNGPGEKSEFSSTPPSMAIGISRKSGAGRYRSKSGLTGTTRTVASALSSTRHTMPSRFQRRRCALWPMEFYGSCQKAGRSYLWIRGTGTHGSGLRAHGVRGEHRKY